MDIREYLKSSLLVMDGAMGTYYDRKNDLGNGIAEKANLVNPSLIKEIHGEYIKNGAKLIRTNTFACNHMLFEDREELKASIKAAVAIANEAVEESMEDVMIAASIGPIRQELGGEMEELSNRCEYQWICDLFLELGISIFIFETFSNMDDILSISEYIKEKSDAFVVGQFILNRSGYTKDGISMGRLIKEAAQSDYLDAYGFNCGIGAAHLYELLKKVEFPNDKYITALPNSGYPHVVRGRSVYSDSPSYYGSKMVQIRDLGVNMIGGCCGTTPKYIRTLIQELNGTWVAPKKIVTGFVESSLDVSVDVKVVGNAFVDKLIRGEKVIAVELDPPFNENADKVMEGAYLLKEKRVDMVTLADSPLARSRADSMHLAIKILNQIDVPVMPHVCCRDKNMIAMQSQLLGGHMNGIRNLLLVTGDPVSRGDKDNITGVFDFNSIRLMNFVKDMNVEHFKFDPIYYGGALNYSGVNPDKIVERMKRKMSGGASYFLTQPIYSKEDIERIAYLKEKSQGKILCGIMPLVSYKNAMFIKNEMPGIVVPDEIVDRYHVDMTRALAEDTAVSVSIDIIKQLYDVADGFYFMTPFNRVALIARIIDEMSEFRR